MQKLRLAGLALATATSAVVMPAVVAAPAEAAGSNHLAMTGGYANVHWQRNGAGDSIIYGWVCDTKADGVEVTFIATWSSSRNDLMRAKPANIRPCQSFRFNGGRDRTASLYVVVGPKARGPLNITI